ncbi:hypothetical protein LSTR_LSTR006243 [Laodelphax striatellus]|uniref:Fucosyltransferase n=1 Tax=Laodelphax striatellus TaxID=195883 RepID=A0A482XR46_LAOST|nr:hypothetical protein LSTR_LSTR006243 [Laodelphax striatellus]
MFLNCKKSIKLTVGSIVIIGLFIIGILFKMNKMQNRMQNPYSCMRGHTSTQSTKGYHWDEQLNLLKGEKPWFMKNGTRWPTAAKIDLATGRRDAKVWPNEAPDSDRMINQFMFMPPDTGKPRPTKKILMWHGLIPWEYPKGDPEPFKVCPVSNCMAVTNKAEAPEVDAILFLNHFNMNPPRHQKPSRQVWILYAMEGPFRTDYFYREDAFNWTATYLQSSDIVRNYGKWVYYDQSKTEWDGPPRNFAAGKTKKVAWIVSNCADVHNNRRMYADELNQFIEVDIYGGCGRLKCPQSYGDGDECFKLLDKDYKFYLSFENSNCREYITEKFLKNGLGHKVIPIVMGAPKEDYERIAPKNSFIHVEDFDSPEHLAAYLHELDQDDDLFNSYFKWKGMGEVLDTYFYCRLCAMLNDDFPDKYYPRFSDFWRKPGQCISGYWRDYKRNIGGVLPSVSLTVEN